MLITSYCSKESVSALQRKLYRKAKQQSECRFYSLYDKVYRTEVLQTAYGFVKQDRGSPGLDEVTFDVIEHEIGKQEHRLVIQEILIWDYIAHL